MLRLTIFSYSRSRYFSNFVDILTDSSASSTEGSFFYNCGHRYGDAEKLSSETSGPKVLFTDNKLTAISGKHLQCITKARRVYSMYILLTSRKGSDDLFNRFWHDTEKWLNELGVVKDGSTRRIFFVRI